ncbi:hypothetical protein FRX31_022337 [Thalictrum thalictroides]|uniref:Response regulatory domain-containing protein n=1 Tax=Thalictrum thalictroides TaxID=46969 RepID=A0A7J6VV68_THATH|nr:hypothetical protein FRX31_022337 [Thalictrum thalictroides]
MSPDGRLPTMARALRQGACFFLRKPFGFQQIQQIWQHSVVRRQTNKSKSMPNLSSEEVESNVNLGESDSEVNNGQNDGNKIWTTELYLDFLRCIEAVSLFADPEPENIYQYMINRGITTVSMENIANLLQLIKGGERDAQEMEVGDDEQETEVGDDDSYDEIELESDDNIDDDGGAV